MFGSRRRRSRRSKKVSLSRFIGPPLAIVLLFIAGYLAYTGQWWRVTSFVTNAAHKAEDRVGNLGDKLGARIGDGLGQGAPAPIVPTQNVNLANTPRDSLRIATFNIQVFGESKASKPEVMQYLAYIISLFDVVAVQEIRDKSTDSVERLLQMVNQAGNPSGKHYQVIVSERMGRTDSKEQYAYIWDSRRVALVPQSAYAVDDPEDLMHRPPFVASFYAINAGNPTMRPFSFTMINVHTDPDEVDQELDVLDDVFQSVRAYEHTEDDVILVGDLNVETKDFGQLGQIPGITSVNQRETNTAGSKAIDHIVLDRNATTEFKNSGVIVYESDFNISHELAVQISDHRPLWAEFSIYENTPQSAIAARPGTGAMRR